MARDLEVRKPRISNGVEAELDGAGDLELVLREELFRELERQEEVQNQETHDRPHPVVEEETPEEEVRGPPGRRSCAPG